jgi:hypothetical protein
MRWMLYEYEVGVFEKRQNLEVSQRNKGTVSVSITINQTYFGIELTPDEAEDFAAGILEISQVVREQEQTNGE